MLSTYLGNAALNKILRDTNFTVTDVYVSLHTAKPGLTGASEVDGNAYARQAAAFEAAASKASENSAVLSFAGMPQVILTHVGLWDADAAGNFLWGGRLAGGEFTALDSNNTFTANGHGMVDDGRIAFEAPDWPGANLPTGISEGTIYWVINADTNTFQVSTTQGGSAVNITADGEGYFIAAKVVNNDDKFEIGAGDLHVDVE